MDDNDLNTQLAARFKQLPKPIQDAITSADVAARMRELAEKHNLHTDQWGILENEVMLTLIGFQPTEDLAKNIGQEVGLQEDAASALAADVSKIVFEPIREELRKQLGEATGNNSTLDALVEEPAPPLSDPAPAPTPPVELAPEQPLVAKVPAAVVAAATPPKGAPTKTVARAPTSSSYAAASPSHERKAIEGDPYREQVA